MSVLETLKLSLEEFRHVEIGNTLFERVSTFQMSFYLDALPCVELVVSPPSPQRVSFRLQSIVSRGVPTFCLAH